MAVSCVGKGKVNESWVVQDSPASDHDPRYCENFREGFDVKNILG